MELINTSIQGVYGIKHNKIHDARGYFVKTFSLDIFNEKKINFKFEESFYTTSHKNVFRGLHFQLPPYQIAKVVFIISGRVTDFIVDLRKDSSTYGCVEVIDLCTAGTHGVFIPEGCAHGFLSLEDNSTLMYHQSKKFNPTHDAGIHYSIIEKIKTQASSLIISDRDKSLIQFKDFKSNF